MTTLRKVAVDASVASTWRGTVVRSGTILFVRQLVVQGASAAAGIYLARELSPVDFGVYALIAFLNRFLILVTDSGISSGLIRQQEEPTAGDLNAMFSLLQLLYTSVFLLAIPIIFVYHTFYPSVSVPMLLVMSFSTYLAAYRSLPAVLLERKLDYGKLSIVEGAENVSFQVVAVGLAFFGYGVWSFVWAAFFSRLVGLVLVNWFRPGRYRLTPRLNRIRAIVQFGMLQQLNSVLMFVRDALSITFIGSVLGTASVGYLNFGIKVNNYPLLPLSMVNRIMFPLFSRTQSDVKTFSESYLTILKAYAWIFYAGSAAIYVFVPTLVYYVFSPKWMPEVPVIRLLLLGNLLFGVSAPTFAALNAKGLNRINVVATSAELVAIWGIGVPLIDRFGLIGYGYAQFASVAVAVGVMAWAKRYIHVSYLRVLLVPLTAYATMAAVGGWLSSRSVFHSFVGVMIGCLAVFLLYLSVNVVCDHSVRGRVLRWIESSLHRGSRPNIQEER